MPTRRSPASAPATGVAPSAKDWFVYVIRAREGVLYAGITTDVQQRLSAHVAGRGAKYLRGRGPLQVVYRRKLGERSLALRVEQRLKRLSKVEKERLVCAQPLRRRLLALLELSKAAATRA